MTEVNETAADAAENEPATPGHTGEADSAPATVEPSKDVAAPPRRPVRGVVLAVLGFVALFLHMACSKQLPHGGLIGAFSALVMTFGLLDAIGAFRASGADRPLRETAFGPLEGEAM